MQERDETASRAIRAGDTVEYAEPLPDEVGQKFRVVWSDRERCCLEFICNLRVKPTRVEQVRLLRVVPGETAEALRQRAYVAAWRKLRALPDTARVSLSWDRPNELAGDVKREFRQALDRRINIRGGMPEANDPVDIGLIRDAHRLDGIKKHRIRVYQFESELCRRRFGHLLARHDD